MKTISYILPHKNRTELLEPNLLSLRLQTSKNFEVIIVDNSTPDYQAKLKDLVSRYRNYGLKIRLFFVDPSKCKFYHNNPALTGYCNPALSQNIGAKKAVGEILVLSSPEVVNAHDNVATINKIFEADFNSKFLLGWIDERPLRVVLPHISLGFTTAKVKELFKSPGNAAMCRDDVPHRPWLNLNYFLGVLKREDFIRIGGMEERFMQHVAWEDNEYAQRCELSGFPAQFCGDIAGIHLTHSRGYQTLENPNKQLWEKLEKEKPLVANVGHDWGSDACIVEEL